MKKAKIIIPALAVVCLSAAATVSGTVAWFAASKTATSSVNDIAVINPEGSLKVSTTAIANTVAKNGNISMVSGWSLRDASVQAAKNTTTATVWKATDPDATTGKATTFAQVDPSTNYVYSTSKSIAYCAAWKMTFTMDGNSPDAYTIKFNVSSSTIEVSETEDAIYAAYRIAIFSKDGLAIWAPKESSTNLTYVSGTSKCTDTYTKATGEVSLGSIYATGSGKTGVDTSLDVYAYMWFEGTSENCVVEKLATGKTVNATATLSFNA